MIPSLARSFPLDLAAVLFFFLLAWAAGLRILKGFRVGFPSLILESCFSLGIGLAVFSILTFGLGFSGQFNRGWLGAGAALIGIISFREMKEVLLRLIRTWAFVPELKKKGFFLFAMGFLALAAALSNLIFNYAPPTQAREMLYDLTLPKLYLQAGRIFDLPYQKEFYYPLEIQMLYGFVMAFRGALAAKLVHYFLGIACSVSLFAIGEVLWDRRSAFFAAVIFYCSPLVTSLSGAANVDFGTLFYGLLAFSCCALFAESAKVSHWFLGSFLSGIALSTKVTGIAVPIATFGWGGRLLWKSAAISTKKRWALWAGGLILCGVAFSPWPLKNWIFTGNPLAPFSVPWLGLQGHEAAAVEVRHLHLAHATVTFREIAGGFHNLLFGDFIFGGGPLLFAFVLPAFLDSGKKRAWSRTAVFAALNFIVLFALLPYPHRFYENRYYGVSTGLIALFSGAGLAWSLDHFGRRRMIQGLALGGLVFPGIAFSFLFSAKRLPLWLGRQTPDQYLEQKLPFYGAMRYAREHLGPESRVLMLGSNDAHSFYWNGILISPPQSLLEESDPEKILARLQSLGITHILWFRIFYEEEAGSGIWKHLESPVQSLHWPFRDFEKENLTGIYEDGQVTLFELKKRQAL